MHNNKRLVLPLLPSSFALFNDVVGFTLGFTQEPHRPPAGGGPSTDPKMGVHIPLIVSLRGKKLVEIYSDLIESMQMGRGKEK